MAKKVIPYILLVLGAAAVIVIKKCKSNSPVQKKTTTVQKDPSQEVNRNRGFDRRVSFIEYTEHAKCRMDCRHITQAEVEDIMRNGNINYKKSDVDAKPCPTYALEGTTSDNQHVRIVFAQCDYKTKVVTCIDLGTEWECHCPGDDKKYENNN